MKINKQDHYNDSFTGNITEMHSSKFVGCIFKEADLRDSFIVESTFIDCRFINCNMKECIINNSRFQNPVFMDTDITSATIFKSHFITGSFSDTKFNNSIVFDSYIRGNHMKNTSFVHTRFGFEVSDKKAFPLDNQTDFIENTLERCDFTKAFARGCNFMSNEFELCNVQEFDLCYSTLDYSRFINTIMRFLIREYTSNVGVESVITQKMWKG